MAGCSATLYVKDEQGSTFIPASQRPDGTWRKSRRVKDGYVPPEEVPLYESKGKQFIKNKPLYPPGYTPDVKQVKNKKSSMTSPIPGLVINNSAEGKTNKKKKKKQQIKNVENTSEQKVNSSQACSSSTSTISTTTEQVEPPVTNPEKRIKNLRKRLKEIESIQERINSGILKNPEQDQLDKISRKSQVESEIETLMAHLNNVIIQ
ncbi:partner of Y14 and mago [Anabrus simplex]|uniref:partner of Y14 and mago n=1 Tax=Anabrus simplex TaxID=316456 RepID=UPI0035A30034